jgi:hypothetical protein
MATWPFLHGLPVWYVTSLAALAMLRGDDFDPILAKWHSTQFIFTVYRLVEPQTGQGYKESKVGNFFSLASHLSMIISICSINPELYLSGQGGLKPNRDAGFGQKLKKCAQVHFSLYICPIYNHIT